MIYERKIKLKDSINKIKDSQVLKKIFLLVRDELTNSGIDKYTHNNNGVFFDMNILSNDILEKIEKLVEDNIKTSDSDIKTQLNVYSNDDSTEYMKVTNGLKLSNKEKNLFNNSQMNK